jgi:hypothetical protein
MPASIAETGIVGNFRRAARSNGLLINLFSALRLHAVAKPSRSAQLEPTPQVIAIAYN